MEIHEYTFTLKHAIYMHLHEVDFIAIAYQILSSQYEATLNKVAPFSRGDFVRCLGRAGRSSFPGCALFLNFTISQSLIVKLQSRFVRCVFFFKYGIKCLKIEQSHPISPIQFSLYSQLVELNGQHSRLSPPMCPLSARVINKIISK